jgi:hypothetical protein
MHFGDASSAAATPAATPLPQATVQPVPGMTFDYHVSIALNAGQANVPANFQITDHDFIPDFLNAVSSGSFKIQMKIGDRYLSNVPVVAANIFGTGQAPMPVNMGVLKINTIVYLTLTDTSGNPNQVDITFRGRQVN